MARTGGFGILRRPGTGNGMRCNRMPAWPTWRGRLRYPGGGLFSPACVVYATVGGPRKRPQQQEGDRVGRREGPPSAYYLVGQWSRVQVDPSVWGFGQKMAILEYSVNGDSRV